MYLSKFRPKAKICKDAIILMSIKKTKINKYPWCALLCFTYIISKDLL